MSEFEGVKRSYVANRATMFELATSAGVMFRSFLIVMVNYVVERNVRARVIGEDNMVWGPNSPVAGRQTMTGRLS